MLTPAERERAQRLNRKISEINDQMRKTENNDPASLDSVYGQLDAARLEYQSFQDTVYVAHPELRVRSGYTGSIDRTDIDRLARDSDCAYMEYVVSNDRVYLFVITANKLTNKPELKTYPLAIKPDLLAKQVDEFHNRLANRHPDYSSDALELFALVVGPATEQLRGVKTLCIVPDGFLWNLPFQALMSVSNRHLLEDYAIYYAPSLSVLRHMNQKEQANGANSTLLAFGNPIIGKDEQREQDLCPLPEAENEVRDIANTFDPKARRVFIGREATEMTFKALAPSYSVIHLATHGALDNRQPLYSHVLLTKTDGDSENDGLLEAREIMNMRLSADLAVLSACETANGKISPGEGVIGMSWAFFVAGTRSMVVSQWKVNSASTSSLLMNFYRTLKSNQSDTNARKARALREAAVSLMKTGRYHHPFYWAGFVLVGRSN